MSAAVLEIARRATPEDWVCAETGTDRSYELVDGDLREKTMGKSASLAATRIAVKLGIHCDATGAGWVFGSDAAYRCFPDNPQLIRKPDASFVALQRLNGEEDSPFITVAPDLIVEVLSATNSALEIDGKMDEFFRAGTRLVWVVNPQLKWVIAHTAAGTARRLRENDTLTGDDVLPGFACRVGEIFHRPALPA